MLNIWRSDIRHKRPLTLPVPIVIHHGRQTWSARPFHFWFEGITDSLKAFVPSFEFVLTDLAQMEKDELKAKRLEQLFHVFLAMKNVFDVPELLRNATDILNFAEGYFETEEGRELFEMVLIYFELNAPIEQEELREIIHELTPSPKSFAMSVYEKIKKEGKIEEAAIKDRSFVVALLKNTDWDDARIAYVAGVSAEFVRQIRQESGQPN